VFVLGLFERLHLGQQLALGLALGIQVAPRLGADAAHVGDHALGTVAGRK
jgi:hypothetical protein